MATEGLRSEGVQTEGLRSEGRSSMVTGTLSEELSRFRGQSERFRRGGPETDLHRQGGAAQVQVQEPTDGLLETIGTREGLAQAILAAEILGKPRALRPYRSHK